MVTNHLEKTEGSDWLDNDAELLPEGTRTDVTRRRRELYDAMKDLEIAVSRPSASPVWRPNLRSALVHLESALDRHVLEVESEDGLFAEVIDREPRMTSSVNSLREGHVGLQAACRYALDGVENQMVSTDRIRQRINRVLARLARHRQKGSEMLYDAYMVDVATGD